MELYNINMSLLCRSVKTNAVRRYPASPVVTEGMKYAELGYFCAWFLMLSRVSGNVVGSGKPVCFLAAPA